MPVSSRLSIQSNQSPTTQTWLTVTEAAVYLKIRPRTLLLWVRQGKVKAYALSGTKRRVWRFRQADLDAAMMESTVLPSSAPSVALAYGRMQ